MTKMQADKIWDFEVEMFKTAIEINELATRLQIQILERTKDTLNKEFNTTEWTSKFFDLLAKHNM